VTSKTKPELVRLGKGCSGLRRWRGRRVRGGGMGVGVGTGRRSAADAA
jgi:hypothetical protein